MIEKRKVNVNIKLDRKFSSKNLRNARKFPFSFFRNKSTKKTTPLSTVMDFIMPLDILLLFYLMYI